MRARLFVEPQFGATYDDQLAAARAAEAAGFDAFFRSDHYLTMGGDGLPGPTDTWTTLAGLARDTSTIRLGSMLSAATFRLPGPLAVTVAQIDAMSGGRVELGLGAAWFAEEHAAYGIPFPPQAERFARLAEQLEIIEGLWASPVGERYSFTGRHYELRDSPALPKPVQRPRPPVIVGGAGPSATPRLAARFADEYNTPFFPPRDAAAQFDRVRAACRDAGRDPSSLRLSSAVTVCCGARPEDVARRAARIGRDPDELRQHAAAGSPDEVAARLRQFGDAGAEVVYLQVLDMADLDHVELLGRAVLPRIA